MTSAATLLIIMARETQRAVTSEFELFLLACQLFHDRGYAGQSLPSRNATLSTRRAQTLIAGATLAPAYYSDMAADDLGDKTLGLLGFLGVSADALGGRVVDRAGFEPAYGKPGRFTVCCL